MMNDIWTSQTGLHESTVGLREVEKSSKHLLIFENTRGEKSEELKETEDLQYAVQNMLDADESKVLPEREDDVEDKLKYLKSLFQPINDEIEALEEDEQSIEDAVEIKD